MLDRHFFNGKNFVQADRIFDFSYAYLGLLTKSYIGSQNSMGERTTHNMNVCTDLKSKLMEILQVAYVIFSLSSTTREGSSPREICFTN